MTKEQEPTEADKKESAEKESGEPSQSAQHADAPKSSGSKPDPGKRGQESASESIAEANNNFYGPVYAHGGSFGINGAGSTARRLTGKVSQADIDQALEFYVQPSMYDRALEVLVSHRVVFLAGSSGSGRRAAALSLLRSVSMDQVIALPPALTLVDLAQREYRRGHVYLIAGWTGFGAAPPDEHALSLIHEKVSASSSYFVVGTSPQAAGALGSAADVIMWAKPSMSAFLRVALAEGDMTQEQISQALEQVPEGARLERVARFARRLAQGETARVASGEFDDAAQGTVAEWFTQRNSSREILDVAALCFLAGSTEREFEARRILLDAHMEEQFPRSEETADAGGVPEFFPEYRAVRTDEKSLISTDRVGVDANARRVVRFKLDVFQKFALEQLSDRLDSRFWDAITAWLNDLVEGEVRVELSKGVAGLASVNLDEVAQSFLEPWSNREQGWFGQIHAAHTLWFMTNTEELSAAALQISARWCVSPNKEQRWTAALALSGELGIQYPTDAMRRLWQLSKERDESVGNFSRAALAILFASLVDAKDDAAVLLPQMLDNNLADEQVRRQPAVLASTTRTALAVLMAQSFPDPGELRGCASPARRCAGRTDRQAVAVGVAAPHVPAHGAARVVDWSQQAARDADHANGRGRHSARQRHLAGHSKYRARGAETGHAYRQQAVFKANFTRGSRRTHQSRRTRPQ